MAKEVHFELFKRQGARGGWKLHDCISQRDDAMKLAQEIMDGGEATGVKVVKETYDSDTGDYLTLKIFEDGHNQAKVDPAAEDVPDALPCFKPDDLYSYHARATMARLLADFLARQKLTVTELIHRADALETLRGHRHHLPARDPEDRRGPGCLHQGAGAADHQGSERPRHQGHQPGLSRRAQEPLSDRQAGEVPRAGRKARP